MIYKDPAAPVNNQTTPISQTTGTISYWRWSGNSESAWYPLKDWSWNKAHQSNGYYEFEISNLKNIQQVGQYSADMTWTIKDAP